MKIFLTILFLYSSSFACFLTGQAAEDFNLLVSRLDVIRYFSFYLGIFLFIYSSLSLFDLKNHLLVKSIKVSFILATIFFSISVALFFQINGFMMTDANSLFYYIERHDGLINFIKYLWN